MHAAAQKIARALISHSPFHRCARKISRFARNDDAGKALLSFSAYLKRFSLSLSYRHCPIRPFWAPSPRGEGFGCEAAVFSFRRLLHGEKDLGLLPPSSGRRCPEGAEVGSRSGMKSHVRQPVLPFRHPNPCFQTSPFPYGNPFGKRMTAILETFSNQRVTNHMRLRCYLQRGKRNGTTKCPG